MSARFQLASRLVDGARLPVREGGDRAAARLALDVFEKEIVMPGKTVFASVSVAVMFLALLLLGCGSGKDYKQIVVVEGDKAEIVTYGPAPKGKQEIWVPGRTIAFRSNSAIPGIAQHVTGAAGHIYRVSKDMTLEEVAQFELSVPNDSLAYTYGN